MICSNNNLFPLVSLGNFFFHYSGVRNRGSTEEEKDCLGILFRATMI